MRRRSLARIELLDAALVTAFLAVVAVLLILFHAADPRAFDSFFGWPDGGVWSNIAASALWAVPGAYVLMRRQARMHREHLAELRTQHAAQMRALRDHHEQVLTTLQPQPGGQS